MTMPTEVKYYSDGTRIEYYETIVIRDNISYIKTQVRKIHANGVLFVEGMMIDGKKHGYWKSLWDNGQYASEKYFDNDQPVGEWCYYSLAGELFSKYDYGIRI